MKRLAEFVKERRKEVNLTQEEFAERAGVALTVVRKIEQGKTNLNMDKVNLVLSMFGHELVPVESKELDL
ncbi:type II toxin-antitoxin system Y4mF family antitoxin [uncultured Draconibacterium sp.]|uniref:type II toxin-antitoxin system Y4mF family antitoxin n=1 Tax=uncultured Draconibacterium sp. TaxID=1573823 RepID=UPI00325FEBE1